MHGVGDGGGNAGQANLADAARAELVDFLVGEVDEMHVDGRVVGVDRHDVVGQIAVDRCAVLRVVMRMLEERHADSHYHGAFDLVAAGQGVENSTRIDGRHNATDAQASN